MNVIHIEEESFQKLIEIVVERLKDESISSHEGDPGWKWVSTERAMELLGIKSKTTLQELRDNGEVRFSQHRKKIILYDRDSLNDYLEKHAKETF